MSCDSNNSKVGHSPDHLDASLSYGRALDVDIHDQDMMYQMGVSYGQIAGVHGWKDLSLKFLFVSDYTAKIFGYTHFEELISTDLSIADMRCRASEMAELIEQEDQWVFESNKSMLKIEYLCFASNHWKVMLGEKYPVKNLQGEVVALGMALHDITDTNLAILNYDVLCHKRSKRYGDAEQFSYVIEGGVGDVMLTQRQQEVIFYLLRGYIARSIAYRLGVSNRTVHDHIDTLKSKFACLTKRQLIDKLLALGCLNLLPRSCLRNNPFKSTSADDLVEPMNRA